MRISFRLLSSTIMLLFFIAISLTTIHAQDKTFEPYASIRFYAGYTTQSEEVSDNNESDTDLLFNLASNSRFGGKFTLDDKLKGHIEIGLNSSASNATLRLAYVVYTMDTLELQFGQDYTPNTFLSSAMTEDDTGGQGFGALYDNRQPFVKVSMMGIYLALVKPAIPTSGDPATEITTGTATTDEVDSIMPKTIIGYNYKDDMITLGVGGAYNVYEIDDTTGTGIDGEKIHAGFGFIHGAVNASGLTAKFSAGYGINFANYGIKDANNQTLYTKAAIKNGDSVENTMCMSGYGELGYNIMGFGVYAGGGYAQGDNNENTEVDKQWMAYAGAKIPLGIHIFVQPEFNYRDYMEDETCVDQGTEYFAGVKFQADLQ